MKTNFTALRIMANLGSQKPFQILILSALATSFSYLVHFLSSNQQTLRAIISIIELTSILTMSVLLQSKSLFLGFVVTYSFASYLVQTIFVMMPEAYQPHYLNFLLFAVTYSVIEFVKDNYPQQLESIEHNYLSGFYSSKLKESDQFWELKGDGDFHKIDKSKMKFNYYGIIGLTMTAAIATFGYQMILTNAVKWVSGADTSRDSWEALMYLCKYSCLSFGSYCGLYHAQFL